MKFEIQSKDSDGNIVFQGTANQGEASFLLNVGVNYLLGQGVAPMLTGNEEEDGLGLVAEAPDTVQ